MAVAQSARPDRLRPGPDRPARSDRLRPAAVLVLVAAATFVLGVRDASFDSVAWQQAAIVTWLVLGLGFALGLWDGVRLPRGVLVALVGGVALVAWTALSLLWSPSASRTLGEVARLAFYLGVVLLVAFAARERDREAAGAGLALGVVAVCALALANRLLPDLFSEADRASLVAERQSYPIGYWNGLAGWAAMGLGLTLGWSAQARAPLARGLALAAVPVCVLALYVTYSRSGLGDLVVAVLVVLLFAPRRITLVPLGLAAGVVSLVAILIVRDHRELAQATGGDGGPLVLLVLGVGGALCLAVGAATAAIHDGPRSRRAGRGLLAATGAVVLVLVGVAVVRELPQRAWDEFNEEVQTADTSADPASRLSSFQGGRKLVWQGALEAFGEEPAQGIGAGTFDLWWNQDGGGESLRDGHSLYLEVLAELGVPGFLALLVLLGGLAWAALRGPPGLRARPALLAAFAVFLFHAGLDWMWELAALACVALAAAVLAAGGRDGAPLGRAWRIGLPVLALLVCLLQVPGLAGTSLVRRSQDAARAGDPAEAFALAEDAIAAEPWAGAPYGQRALVEESAGALGRAARSARLAIEREPEDWHYPVLLARIEAQRGNTDAALTAIRRARELRPASDFLTPSSE